ncbi:hypothetical protein [Paenibacillus pseudetheri]|nr:hypothetical protein [Paenibacillus pseudetheri]
MKKSEVTRRKKGDGPKGMVNTVIGGASSARLTWHAAHTCGVLFTVSTEG